MSKSTRISNTNKNALLRASTDKEIKKDSKSNSTRIKTETQKKTTTKDKKDEAQDKLILNRNKTVLNKNQNLHLRQKSKAVEPLRARHSSEILNSLKNSQNRPTAKSNVMNSVHNVTVLSPPTRRKQITPVTETKLKKISQQSDQQEDQKKDTRSRTRTRTLEPDEVVVLKTSTSRTSGPKSLGTFPEKTMRQNTKQSIKNEIPQKVSVKEAVAFEINFDKKNSQKHKQEKQKKEVTDVQNRSTPEIEKTHTFEKQPEIEDDYEDDFESYESDFEIVSSSSAEASEASDVSEAFESSEIFESEAILLKDDAVGNLNENVNNSRSNEMTDDCNESDDDDDEETQPPITVIHKENIDERKLDSGNYDMNSRKEKIQQLLPVQQQQQQQLQQQLDSIDTITGNSEQLDSGISYNTSNPSALIKSPIVSMDLSSSIVMSSSGNQLNHKESKRGIELMKKIRFDTVDCILFDLKPMTYEYFMKLYGELNRNQIATQTNENQMSVDIQTDDYQCRSVWTQHPPQYDLNSMQTYYVGEFDELEDDVDNNGGIDQVKTSTGFIQNDRTLMQSLKALQKFRRNELKKREIQQQRQQQIQKPLNFDRLNEFLNQTVFTISGILNKTKVNQNGKKIQNSNENCSASETLNTNFINALKVVKIFSNSNLNLILTIHESIDDGLYKNEFLNLISIWTTNDMEKPLRLLSTWSEVCRADICIENSDIVVCGLRDGSIAMWDIRETYSFCSKLDGYLKHFPPTQSIIPVLTTSSSSEAHHDNGEIDESINDLGAIVDVKSFQKSNDFYVDYKAYKQIQIVSLNETGIITIWTLIETNNSTSPSSFCFDELKIKNSKVIPNKSKKIEYNSPWSRVKLIQSEIYDLRNYLKMKNVRIKSAFEKTKTYFENELYNDDVLKELQGLTNQIEKNNEFQSNVQGLRFTNLDTDTERIFIGTNRNYIITCTRTLRLDQFRKIVFDETKFLFATTFRILESGKLLVVGLSNGSVIAINCDRNKVNNGNDTRDYDARGDDAGDAPDENSAPRTVDSDFDIENGKSCTIQNIIRNERKYNAEQSIENFPYEMMKAVTGPQDNDEDYLFQIFDQQILLDGSVLRQNLIQHIEYSNITKRLFVLTDGNIRIYDFKINREIKCEFENSSIVGLSMAKSSSSKKHNLITLYKNNGVKIHLL